MTSTALHQHRLKVIRNEAGKQLATMWAALPDHNKPQAEPFAHRAVQVVTGAQLLTARTTAAYLARKTGHPTPRVTASQVTGLRKNTTPLDTYQRPFGKVWQALGNGKPLLAALDIGAAYLAALVGMDAALSAKAASQDFADTYNIKAWVRVADSTACDLCSAADGETLDSPSDMGIHPFCGCTAEPGGDATSSAADPSAIAVHESDEVGPLLYAAGDHFTPA